ncbi:MAG TPA: triose-phosphate isomerase, partial [Candidatus Omnitrophota bacterium]|nr:triose-phosphate isomerase [Candidatus Omnitrophota bacterium]
MRKLFIAGNWKLNKTIPEALELVNGLRREVGDVEEVDIAVCPVAVCLAEVADATGDSNIKVGAQNIYWEDTGAFTGEVSAPIIKEAGAVYVILGHSERRQFFGDTNETVNKKIKAALKHDLLPIVCIGESLEEREAGKTIAVIQKQCEGSFAGLTVEEMEKITIAYEPIWAIGTGKTATSAQAQEVHAFIRGWLKKAFGADLANDVRIQYGGSVKAENTVELLSQPDIDGALVGGASLKVDSFA